MKRSVAVEYGWGIVLLAMAMSVMPVSVGLSGCGSGARSAEDGRHVGEAGATVGSADGRVVVHFPPGAVTEEVWVSITPASEAGADARIVGSTVHDFRPERTQFQLPVRLSISYDPGEIPPQFSEEDLRLCKLLDGGWTGLADSHVDATANLVYGHVDSFSTYGLGPLAAGRALVVEDTWDLAHGAQPVDVALWCDGPQDNWAFVGWADRPLLGMFTGMPSDHFHISSIETFGSHSRVAFERNGRPAPGWPADAAQYALCWIDPTNCRVGYHVFVLRDSDQVGEIWDVEPWGEPGSGPGQFLNPGGLDFGYQLGPLQGHLFIADTGNRRVQEFDVEGNFVRQYGPQTGYADMPEMLEPTDVACSGRWLWVVDRGHHCVWLYVRDPNYINRPDYCFGKWSDGEIGWRGMSGRGRTVAGDDPGGFSAPTAIGSSPDGSSVCVADTGNERVQVFSGRGVLQAVTAADLSVPARSDFTGMTMGGSGRIYVADPERNRVVVLGVRETPS